MEFMTNNHLVALIIKKYPHAIHGRDFWVAHAIDSKTGKQGAQAYIVKWDLADPEPDEAEISALDERYGADVRREFLSREMKYEVENRLKKADYAFRIAIDEDDEDSIKKLKAYRRALRSIPKQDGWPENIVWPDFPDVPRE